MKVAAREFLTCGYFFVRKISSTPDRYFLSIAARIKKANDCSQKNRGQKKRD